MILIISVLYIALIALGTTTYFFPKKLMTSPISEILSRLLLGIAIIVCAMNSLIHLVPGKLSAFITLSIMTILSIISLSRSSNREYIFVNFKHILPFVFMSTLFMFWHLFGTIKIGALVPLRGTGVQDEFYYIFVSDWLYSHSLRDAVFSDTLTTLEYASVTNIHSLPRIGAEYLVVFLASVSSASIIESFVVIHAIGTLLIVYAAAIIIKETISTTKKAYYLMVLLVCLSPVFLFIYGNLNLATAYGIVFMGGYYYFGQRSIFNKDKRPLFVLSGIFLSAMIATYPELLSVIVPSIIFVSAQFLLKNNGVGIKDVLYINTFIVLVASIVAPMALITALKVLSTTGQAVQLGGQTYSNLVADMNPKNFLLLLTTLNTEYKSYSLVSLISISISLFFCPLKVWSKMAGLLVGCSLTFAYFLYKGYGYGLMKAIEFFAFPIAIIFSITIVTMLQVSKNKLFHQRQYIGLEKEDIRFALFDLLVNRYSKLVKQKILGLIILFASLCSVFIWINITIGYQTQFWKLSDSKHLDKNLAELRTIGNLFRSGDILYVSDDTGADPYMVSRWVAYLIRDTPMVFAPSLQEPGYIYDLKKTYESNFPKISHVLRKRTDSNKNALYRNNGYEIVPVEKPEFFFGNGFYADEGGRRWMAQIGEIAVLGNCAESISINVLDRLSGSSGIDKIEVSTENEYKKVFDLSNGNGKIELPLKNVEFQKITLTSPSIAKSPKELGMSEDIRPLTYSVGKIVINKKNNCE